MKALLAALDRSQPPAARPPVWFMRQAGRYLPEYRATRAQAGSFLDLCYTPALAEEVTLQPLRRYPFDASILFADILLVPQALGQKLWFEEGEGPKLGPLEIDKLNRDPAAWHAQLNPIYETLDRLTSSLPGETTLIGFAGAPWTVATYMVEGGSAKLYAKTKALMYQEPEAWAALIELLVEATTAYLSAQIKAGAEVIQLFDSWAGALSHAEVLRWSLAPMAEIAERLRAEHPDVPLILFPRGVGPSYRAFAGVADGLGLDTGLDMAWAGAELGAHTTLQGNLDPALLAVGGKALDAAVDSILETCAGHHHIFNLGHGIWQTTPPEHVTQVLKRIKD